MLFLVCNDIGVLLGGFIKFSCTGGTLILSVVYFYFPVYGGVYWFKGPISTIDSDVLVVDEKIGSVAVYL